MMRILLCFCLSFGVLCADQGVILKQSAEDLSSNKTTSTTAYIEAERVAMNSSVDGKQMGFVYLADGNMMKMIDHSNKTVREMSGEDLEKMMTQVNEAMAKMQEQMKNMPPQQRAMMEKMMGGRMKEMMGAATVKPVYKRADGSAEIAGHSCDWYDGFREEKLFSTLCAADWSSFDLQASDFAVLQKMASFMAKLVPSFAGQAVIGSEDWEQEQTFPGVPVEQTIYMGGKPHTRTTLESVERAAIDASVFESPAGYKVEKGVPKMR